MKADGCAGPCRSDGAAEIRGVQRRKGHVHAGRGEDEAICCDSGDWCRGVVIVGRLGHVLRGGCCCGCVCKARPPKELNGASGDLAFTTAWRLRTSQLVGLVRIRGSGDSGGTVGLRHDFAGLGARVVQSDVGGDGGSDVISGAIVCPQVL